MRRLIIILASLFSGNAYSQEGSLSDHLLEKYVNVGKKKSASLHNKVSKQYNKTLSKIISEEIILKNMLLSIDSMEGNRVFGNVRDVYGKWVVTRSESSTGSESKLHNLPYLDTLLSSVKHLQLISNESKLLSSQSEFQELFDGFLKLDSILSRTINLQQFLKERRTYLKQQLSKWNLEKSITKLDKNIYYLGQSLDEFKSLFNSKSVVERKILQLIRSSDSFKDLLNQRRSLIPGFAMPLSVLNTSRENNSGLQTRFSVQEQIRQLPIDSLDPATFLDSRLEENKNSQSEPSLGQLATLGRKYLGEQPGFKVNGQKGKGFFRRVELGCNIQFGKFIKALPSSGELAFSLGYKVNDKVTSGLAASYRLGFSERINKLSISHQGFGIRSFLDWQFPRNFYASGGFEVNYFPGLRSNIQITGEHMNLWQTSLLMGATKRYSIGKRKGAIQVYLDIKSLERQSFRSPILVRNAFFF